MKISPDDIFVEEISPDRKFSFNMGNYYISYKTTDKNIPKQYLNHRHSSYEIIYILKGFGTYGTDKFSVPVLPNNLILTPSSTYHFLCFQYDKPYERILININHKEFNELLEKNTQGVPQLLNIEGNKLFLDYFSKLSYCFQLQDKLEPKYFDMLMRHNIEEIIFYLSSLSLENFSKKDVTANYPPIVIEIIDYIANNLSTISINEIAKKFSISPTYVCVLFKKYLQTSPINYIISKRLAYATTLIEKGEKIQNAAYACGYQNYSSFFRAYQKAYGVSPSQNK